MGLPGALASSAEAGGAGIGAGVAREEAVAETPDFLPLLGVLTGFTVEPELELAGGGVGCLRFSSIRAEAAASSFLAAACSSRAMWARRFSFF